MFLDHFRAVTKPFTDLVKRYAGRGAKTGESAAHGMGGYPFKSAILAVLPKRECKIISVSITTSDYAGLEHIWFPRSIHIEELKKLSGQWDCSLFSILETDGWGFAQVEQPSVQVKPESPGLNDLVLP